MTDSNKYTNMSIDWETDSIWKRVYEAKEITDNADNDKEEELPTKCLININDL